MKTQESTQQRVAALWRKIWKMGGLFGPLEGSYESRRKKGGTIWDLYHQIMQLEASPS